MKNKYLVLFLALVIMSVAGIAWSRSVKWGKGVEFSEVITGSLTADTVVVGTSVLENQISSAATATGSINLDGTGASDYNYSNGGTAATYTIGFTTLPEAGKVRFITVTFGGGAGVCTLNWTGDNFISWMGGTAAAATTTNKRSTYACKIDSTGAYCKVVAEGY